MSDLPAMTPSFVFVTALAVNYRGRIYAIRGLTQGGKDTLPEITNLATLIEDLRALADVEDGDRGGDETRNPRARRGSRRR